MRLSLPAPVLSGHHAICDYTLRVQFLYRFDDEDGLTYPVTRDCFFYKSGLYAYYSLTLLLIFVDKKSSPFNELCIAF